MHLKIFVFIYLFCVAYIQAQQPDSLSQQEIRKELETIKQFRQKDSIRIAMLLNEIQLLINNEKNTPSITNSSTTNEKEIEKLRNKMRGLDPIVLVSFASYGFFIMDNDMLAVVLYGNCWISNGRFAWAIFIFICYLHITSLCCNECFGQSFFRS